MLLHCQPNVKLTRPDNLKLFHPGIQIVLAMIESGTKLSTYPLSWVGGQPNQLPEIIGFDLTRVE